MRFHGVLPALVTPFDSNGKFVAKVCEKLLAHLYGKGVHGVYALGNTGEGMQQSVAQRKTVAECVRANTPRDKQVIVHVGSAILDDSLELARHAAKLGADAISSLPPPGIGNFAEILNWYRAIAASCDIPLLVYYFPEVAPAIATQSQLEELCALPNVIGLKFTDFDLFRLYNLKSKGAVMFNGRDEVFAAGLLMGADGGIGTFYNALPELFVDIYEASRRGDWQQARHLQATVCQVIEAAIRYPVFGVTKVWLARQGFACGPCLAPRRNLGDAEAAAFFDTVDAILGAVPA